MKKDTIRIHAVEIPASTTQKHGAGKEDTILVPKKQEKPKKDNKK